MKASVLSLGLLFGWAAQADVVLTMGGDVNFIKSGSAPRPDVVAIPGGNRTHADLISGIAPLINGEINFANVETVVSERNLTRASKTFHFISHPNGIREMLRAGFNLFALANNHSWDANEAGIHETLGWMARLRSEVGGRLWYAGLGLNRQDAAAPSVFRVAGKDGRTYTVAFSALSFAGQWRATDSRPGMPDYRTDADYELVLNRLRSVAADLKILSIHFGTESKITLDAGQRDRFRRAVVQSDVDLVIGHHPHVVRPVELTENGKLILYSLGNYMMVGSANITGRPLGYDYGLFGRVYFGFDQASGRLKAQAMEAVPLTMVHNRSVPLTGARGQQRVDALNRLSVSQVGAARAVQFQVRSDGTGVACKPDLVGRFTARAARICGAR